MSSADIDRFFQDYVYGFILGDVQREVDLARRGDGGGNYLAALGLLCYTEVLGGIARGTLAARQGRKNFNEFFRSLGPEFAAV